MAARDLSQHRSLALVRRSRTDRGAAMPVGRSESCGLLPLFAAEHARTGRFIIARTLARVSRGASPPARLPATDYKAAARRVCDQSQARTTFDARRQSAVLAANKVCVHDRFST